MPGQCKKTKRSRKNTHNCNTGGDPCALSRLRMIQPSVNKERKAESKKEGEHNKFRES